MKIPSLASSTLFGLPHRCSMMRLRSAALRSCSFFNSSAAFLRSNNYLGRNIFWVLILRLLAIHLLGASSFSLVSWNPSLPSWPWRLPPCVYALQRAYARFRPAWPSLPVDWNLVIFVLPLNLHAQAYLIISHCRFLFFATEINKMKTLKYVVKRRFASQQLQNGEFLGYFSSQKVCGCSRNILRGDQRRKTKNFLSTCANRWREKRSENRKIASTPNLVRYTFTRMAKRLISVVAGIRFRGFVKN